MYPNLYYFFKDIFSIELPFLKLVNTFGFFVALAFIIGAWVLTAELKRKQAMGLLNFTEEKVKIGAPASFADLLINFLLGFVFGYKIIGAFVVPEALNDPQSFILSSEGSMGFGILLGLIMAGIKWYEKNKQKLSKPEERSIRIWPHDRVGDIVIFAAIFGFAGAKVFHNLENWNEFIKNPIDALISFSGLTFYGGLICATLAIVWYAKRYKIKIIHLADAMSPTMMLAYAIGRMGCHMSGDGDWGIPNIHPKPLSWLPDWAWAYHYPNNVINEGVKIAGCEGQYCNQLKDAVYPTPLFEVLACSILFYLLWSLRKKIKMPGIITGIYLLLNGLERFTIEKIRVNTKYEGLPFQPTQAELISFFLVLMGILFLVMSKKWFASKK